MTKFFSKPMLKKLNQTEVWKKENALNDILKKAEEESDLLSNFKAFKKTKDKEGKIYELNCIKGESLRKTNDLDDILKILEVNMKDKYIENNWGWSISKKKKEFLDSSTRLLIIRQSESNKMVGYLSFRFLLEDNKPVLYVYEIQILKEFRGNKFGRHLLILSELLANKFKMSFVMLTVFKNNVKAQKFFRCLNFKNDENSPKLTIFDAIDINTELTYDILSKKTKYSYV